jgi:hypothetical protein
MNLKCHYSENCPSFWVFRYVKATNEFLFLKLVYHRNAKEVQNGILQTNYHSYVNQLQVDKR